MKNKIILIGALGHKGQVYDGETFKNSLFIKYFKRAADKLITINTTRWNKKPWLPFEFLIKLVFNPKSKIVISACDVNACRLIALLYHLGIRKNVFYWVVGGGLHKLVGDTVNVKYLKAVNKILVQSPDMKQTLCLKGLNNVMYFPNSKDVYDVKSEKYHDGKVHFVFLSRIIPEKGCDLIVNCAKRLIENGYKINITFYGKSGYPIFEDKISEYDYINYKGLLNLKEIKGYEKLGQHDVFLFPTFYPNEGFPGVLIDAFISGLPIITTDWNYNKEIVENGKTGIVIPPNDEDALYNAMTYLCDNPCVIKEMSKACKKEAHRYDSSNLLSIENLKKIGLIN